MAGYDHSVYMLISCVRQCMVYNNLVIVFVYGRGFHIGSCGFMLLVIADVILNRTIVSCVANMYCLMCMGATGVYAWLINLFSGVEFIFNG